MNISKSLLTAAFFMALNGLYAQAIPVVVLNQKGEITVSGKKVGLENLRREVQHALIKLPTVPEEVPIKFVGETGMGMRAEVRTEVSDAIAGAKWLKKSKAVVTAKSVSTTPSVAYSSKGGITVSGKKVALEGLKKELQTELLKQDVIPSTIPVKYTGQTGMGMRGEINTELNDAIKGAKWLRKKAALDILNEPIEKELAQNVQLQVQKYKTVGNFAFIMASPRQPNGKAIDFSKTPYQEAIKEKAFNETVYGLLKFENGAWKILKYSMGSTDASCACWWKDYNAPKALFSAKMIKSNCP